MVTSSAIAAGQIKANIQSAQAEANKGVTIKYTASHGNYNDLPKSIQKSTFASRAMPMLASESISDFVRDRTNFNAPKVGTPEDVTQIVTTSRIVGNQSRYMSNVQNNSKSIVSLSAKIDALIKAFKNANLTVNLQPMRLNQKVVADGVKEQFTIDDMLSNYGKGKW